MRKLQTQEGKVVTKTKEILAEQHRFYADLYQSNPKIKFNIQNSTTTKINEIDKEKCDQPISIDELTEALKGLRKQCTPGINGLTTEWYQFFWQRIKHMYYEAIMYAKKQGKLHLSARRGVIMLIPKINHVIQCF